MFKKLTCAEEPKVLVSDKAEGARRAGGAGGVGAGSAAPVSKSISVRRRGSLDLTFERIGKL